MNLYKISQEVNTGYDTYSDAVVAAESEEEARRTHPADTVGEGHYSTDEEGNFLRRRWHAENADTGRLYERVDNWYATWAYNVSDVRVDLVGVAVEGTPAGVICASFHAG